MAGSDGNLWFVDGGRWKVGRMTASGAVTEFDLPAIVGGPSGITAGPDGNIWVTTNALGQGRQDWILRINRDGVVSQFQAGTGSGFSGTGPETITTGPDGNLWFTEFWSNRIGRVTPAGDLTEFPIPTPDSNPRGIASGPDGRLWFVESNFNRTAVARMTTSGEVTEYPLGGSAIDQLQPDEIVAGPDGNMWFSQPHPSAPQGEVGRITTSGAVTLFPFPAGGRPVDLAAGPDGNIWVTDPGQNAISRVSPTGVFRQFALPRRTSQPSGIAAGRDGRMWFTEGGRIGSIGVTVPEPKPNARVLRFSSGAAPVTHSVTITNNGDAPLHISSATFVGADQSEFAKAGDNCSGRVIAVRGACRIDITFKPGGGSGLRAARLAITDDATGSPQSVSLLAQLPDCRLPLFASTASNPTGEFLSLPDGQIAADPNGAFVASGARSRAQPVLSGTLPPAYDRIAGRWVPGVVSPDGSRYAYVDYSHPPDFQLHVVDVATGRDRLLPLTAGFWSMVGFTSEGIYVHQAYEGIGPGLWLVNPNSGTVSKIFNDARVDLVSGKVAWIEARDNTDPLPEPPGMGGATNEVQSRDLTTSVTTTWFYRPGSSMSVVGAAQGSIVVSGYDIADSYLWVVSGPGQAVAITDPGSGDNLPYSGGMAGDANGWWLGSLDGLYLWTPRTGAVLVSESTAAPAGVCA